VPKNGSGSPSVFPLPHPLSPFMVSPDDTMSSQIRRPFFFYRTLDHPSNTQLPPQDYMPPFISRFFSDSIAYRKPPRRPFLSRCGHRGPINRCFLTARNTPRLLNFFWATPLSSLSSLLKFGISHPSGCFFVILIPTSPFHALCRSCSLQTSHAPFSWFFHTPWPYSCRPSLLVRTI